MARPTVMSTMAAAFLVPLLLQGAQARLLTFTADASAAAASPAAVTAVAISPAAASRVALSPAAAVARAAVATAAVNPAAAPAPAPPAPMSAKAIKGALLLLKLDKALESAKAASKEAQDALKEMQGQKEAIAKIVPQEKEQLKAAKAAYEAARALDDKMIALFKSTSDAVRREAEKAASAYLVQVKQAVETESAKKAAAAAQEKAATDAANKKLEETAQAGIKSAVRSAAAPFEAEISKGKANMADYLQRADALADASEKLLIEASKQTEAAAEYRAQKLVVPTSKALMLARAYQAQAKEMRLQAAKLREVAEEISATIPAYQEAKEAAVFNATVIPHDA